MLLFLALPAQADNKGEQFFRQMEEKLKKAKTFQCTFEVELEGSAKGSGKGTRTFAEGNKFRVEITGRFYGKPQGMMTTISDGTKVVALNGKKMEVKKQDPKTVHDLLVTGFVFSQSHSTSELPDGRDKSVDGITLTVQFRRETMPMSSSGTPIRWRIGNVACDFAHFVHKRSGVWLAQSCRADFSSPWPSTHCDGHL